jgi:DNA-binding beta-propeller fold protein YncE
VAMIGLRGRARAGVRLMAIAAVLSFASALCAVFVNAEAASAIVPEFGSKGSGAEQFSEPNGIAVDQQSGDIYVADTGNSRLDAFTAEGTFRYAIGWGVRDGNAELEVCTAACQSGLSGGAAGEFSSPAAVAVDNNPKSSSFGDFYVVDSGNHRVQKFDSAGSFLLTFGKEVNASSKGNVCTSAEAESCGPGQQELEPGAFFFTAGGLAVDSAGHVLVGDYARVEQFSPGGTFELQWPVGEEGVIPSLAVDSGDEVYVHGEGVTGIHRYSELGTETAPPIDVEGSPRTVTTGPSDEAYVDNGFDEEFLPHIAEYAPSGSQVSAFDIGSEGGSRGIAYGRTIERLYILSSERVRLVAAPPPGPLIAAEKTTNVTSHRATLEAVLDAEGSPAHFHFEYGETTTYGSSSEAAALSEEGGAFAAEHASTQLSGLHPNTTYHFRVVAEDENGHTTIGPDSEFTTLPPAVIGAEFATQVAPDSARLNATLNPLGTATSYHFEYGTTSAYGESVPVPDASAGEGENSATQSAVIEHLVPSTTYHYRLVAENELGEVEGADRTFTTTASENLVLLDGRGWEAVSPAAKDGASLEGIAEEGGLIQSSGAGDALTYTARAPVGEETEGTRSVVVEQLLAKREAGVGWRTRDITTKHEEPAGLSPGQRPEYHFFSTDLSEALVAPEGATPLSQSATERTPYRREADGKFTPLVTPANVPPNTKFGGEELRLEHFVGGVNLVGASSDAATVALSSPIPLTGDFTSAELNPEAEFPTLYAWNAGNLSLIGWLPGSPETPAAIAEQLTALGRRNKVVRHAISRDDQRIIYETRGPNGNPSHLYLRDLKHNRSLQLDGPEAGITAPGNSPVGYQDASEEDNVVYFTDEERLTTNATGSTSSGAADLYRCEVTESASEPHCVLQDVSLPLNSGERADVRGEIIGTDENGEKVFFVANGMLTANAVHGDCGRAPETEAECNLYMYDATSQSVKLVAVLSGADAGDWGLGEEQLTSLTARVSPDGRYVAFMSERPLTGYDNRDAVSGAPDQEVFEYDSVADTLRCVSCNPTGARPSGAFDSGLYPGLLVDRVKSWPDKWLAASIPGWQVIGSLTATYQSRYVANDGRLFFNSFDGLVPSDVNGQSDVYEFEPERVGSCGAANGCVALMSGGSAGGETALLDASESGQDVFFLTKGQLAASDRDNAYDVYDAHVCSAATCESEPRVAPTPCEDLSSCRAGEALVALPPTAVAQLGNGNVVPSKPVIAIRKLTRAQHLAKALRACRKRPRAHRKGCEAQALKRYGAKRGRSRRRK